MKKVTKKLKDLPESVEALKQVVSALMIEEADESSSGFTIEYQDEDQDNVAILDDNDLHLAYEWAKKVANGDLKLIISTERQKKLRHDRRQISQREGGMDQTEDQFGKNP